MAEWLAAGLGWLINHIEVALDQFVGLNAASVGKSREYTEFDTGALLRSAFRDRIEGLARAVQGGIYAPNEARRVEGLPAATDGDEPRVQQQVVPLSFATAPPPPPALPPPRRMPRHPAKPKTRSCVRHLPPESEITMPAPPDRATRAPPGDDCRGAPAPAPTAK